MIIHSDKSLNLNAAARKNIDTRERHKARAQVRIALIVLYPLLSFVAVLAAWAIAAYAVGSSFVLPTISETIVELGALFVQSSFWVGIGYTLLRAVVAFLASCLLAFLFFALSVSFNGFRRFISPIVSVLRALPTMAVALILAVWSGSSYAPVILGGLVLTPMIYSSFISVANVPVELSEITRICGGGRAAMLRSVYIPAIMPTLPSALSSAAGFGVKLVVAAEILCQTANGIGILMSYKQMYFNIGGLFALTVMAVFAALAIEWCLRGILLLINRVLHYD